MKRIIGAMLVVTFISDIAIAQSLKLYTEQTQSGTGLYAQNTEVVPYSIALQLNLENMVFSEGSKTTFVIPSKVVKFKIGELTAIPNSRYKFSYTFKSVLGDVLKKPNLNYVYDLPFAKGGSFSVFQGYNGSLSHAGENSLDFSMPEETLIMAARDGVVAQVVQNNTKACMQEECKKYNNYVTIMHDDGSFASYVHIQHNGALVNVGDIVLKGTRLAMSGNVGYSSGPHLHFVCYYDSFQARVTLATKFRIAEGNTINNLVEGNKYTKNY